MEFIGQKGEFDDCFVYENLIVLVEYTTSSSSNVSDHLKHKKIIFDRVVENSQRFLAYLESEVPAFANRLEAYHQDRYRLCIVYCSRNEFDEAIKFVVDSPRYLDYPLLKYFEKLASSIKLSALPELLHFFEIAPNEIGENGRMKTTVAHVHYPGSLLPEEASGFPKGYKVTSFYADAGSLLERAFVLRRKGWRSSQEAYQRMLIPSKIEAIRSALRTKGQVAINNIIATLPSDVQPIGSDGHPLKPSDLTETKPVTITLPLRANSIGLIDGQHRLFSYYRTKEDDETIARLRHQQNLLVTGIIYPPNLTAYEAERFEAGLFLTINSNQSSAPPDLRQEIEVILNPFSPTAISKQVMERLSASGPLFGQVERYFYDKGKLKTSSIVNYGLAPLLKLNGDDTIFKRFSHPHKGELMSQSREVLEDYIQFSVSSINQFLSAVKSNVPKERWTTDAKVPDRLLSVTFINGFLITMRKLIENGKSLEFDDLHVALADFGSFNTKPFSSSQYNRMAESIAKKYFGIN